MEYLLNGMIHKEEKRERAFKTRISRFVIIQGKLYIKSIVGPYLRCLEDHEVADILKDVHEGDYENHIGADAYDPKC